jgi:glucokinase
VRAGGPACNFGHAGCLEGLASGTAIARQARAMVEAGVPTRIRDFAPRGVVTGVSVARAAGAGDPVAREIFRGAGEALGLAIGGFINILDPARVVIGGGVSRSWHLFAEPMLAAADRVVMSGARRSIDILPADLGDDAGLVGAGLYALDRAEEGQ